ncbi:MAG: hypothetical protein ACXW0Z_17700 [Gemmatirosa sp.]
MSSLVRHLVAVLTLLSVLFGTRGSAHAECDLLRGGGPASASDTRATVAAAAHDGEHAGGRRPGRCNDAPSGGTTPEPTHAPDGHGALAMDACGWVAHCATMTPTPTVIAVADALPSAHEPRAPYRARIPLGPDAEPESPPPRV